MTKNTGPTPFLLAFRMTRIFLTRILFFFHVQIPSLEMFFYKAALNDNNVANMMESNLRLIVILRSETFDLWIDINIRSI